MTDLISRQQVLDRLEVNRPVVDKDSDRQRARYAQWQADVEAVKSVAAEPEEEIIYCGECKHMMANGKCRQFADSRIRPSASDFVAQGKENQ